MYHFKRIKLSLFLHHFFSHFMLLMICLYSTVQYSISTALCHTHCVKCDYIIDLTQPDTWRVLTISPVMYWMLYQGGRWVSESPQPWPLSRLCAGQSAGQRSHSSHSPLRSTLLTTLPAVLAELERMVSIISPAQRSPVKLAE